MICAREGCEKMIHEDYCEQDTGGYKYCLGCLKKQDDAIDLYGNSEPTCPHCGDKFADWNDWDLNQDEEVTHECESCEKEYEVTVNFTITFDTTPVEEQPND